MRAAVRIARRVRRRIDVRGAVMGAGRRSKPLQMETFAARPRSPFLSFHSGARVHGGIEANEHVGEIVGVLLLLREDLLQ